MARLAAAGLLLTFFSVPARSDDAEDLFESRVRPLLVESCFRCHGGAETKSGLRVDSREALLQGGERGPAIVPGEPEASLLVQAVARTHAEVHMPPDDALSAEVTADVARWVAAGAPWPASAEAESAFAAAHWAYEPVRAAEPPADESGWSDHPIDRFIVAGWKAADLRPVAAADHRMLLRRAYFDLIGLPPTPEEAAEFLADESPDALARLVDRLLASPHYGERWGRHWMDVVRYADTAGDNADYPVPEVRLYRDYIIDSFNADRPYDQFVREQLAGDLFAQDAPRERYAELVAATGFLALSRRYATAPYELFHLTLEDTIDTVGQAFLGTSLKCARCHDHKFDPVSTRDYYALYGIFASTQYPWAGGEEFQSKKSPRQKFVPLVPEAEAAPLLAAHQARIDAIVAQTVALQERLATCAEDEKPDIEKQIAELLAEQVRLRASGLPPDLPGAYAVRDGAPVDAAIQLKGDPAQQGPIVPRGAIGFLRDGPLAVAPHESGRRQLADWLAGPDHPLTHRVMVNRIWQRHFGRGIVATPSNFGKRGEPPTHRELLDYLTRRFVDDGFSVKAMHRLILSSRTWQLASTVDPASSAIDTGNLLYWRHDRRRLDAEALRDAMLAVSGRLDCARPGEHPFPPIADWHWTQHDPFRDVYDSRHRSVYLMTQRLQRHPLLALFDGPDTNTSTAGRSSSTVPPQALYLLNSPEVAGIAAAMAERLRAAAPEAPARIDLAHRLCYCRPATEQEVAAAEGYLTAYRQKNVGGMETAEQDAWTSLARILLSANEFMYVD
jgi:hypothetical protein